MARLRTRGEDFVSVGDTGRTDDAYLYLTYLTSHLDDVVLINDVNLNTREVESVLATNRGITDAVVVTRPDRLLGNILHALIAPSSATRKRGSGDSLADAGLDHCALWTPGVRNPQRATVKSP
jgi:acyl-coenzyme A synthetase/AMP-(fatty) acid ligase